MLRSYLGPEADHWVRYGVIDLAVATYGKQQPEAAAQVEVFRFRTSDDAFGAYSSRRGFDRRRLGIADESHATRLSVVVWRGSLVIRTIGSGGAGDGLEALASGIAAPLPSGYSPPAALTAFPPVSIVPGTSALIRDDALGYAMFRGSVLARLRAGDAEVEALRHTSGSPADALKEFEQFRLAVTKSARTIDPVLIVGSEAFFAQDTHLANTLCFRAQNNVVVLRGPATPESLIKLATEIASRIRGEAR